MIMLVGSWSSDAFLLYIRKQVQEFNSGISTKMINTPSFFTITDEQHAHHEDPQACYNPANLTTLAMPQNGRVFTNHLIAGTNLHIF